MTAAVERYPTYKRVTTVIVLAIFALWVGYLLLGTDAKAAGTGVPIGSMAPDFELKSTDGTPVKLSDFAGKPVMLNFWASWCPPCRAEMPAMQEVYKEYEAKGFVILAINLGESKLAVDQFRSKLGLTFTIVIDENDRVTRMYDIVPLPTSYFIDKTGKVVAKWTGEISKEKLRSIAKELTQ